MSDQLLYAIGLFALGAASAALPFAYLLEKVKESHTKELQAAEDKGWVAGYFKAVDARSKPNRDEQGRFAKKPALYGKPLKDKPLPKPYDWVNKYTIIEE